MIGNGMLAGHDTARIPAGHTMPDRDQRALENLAWLAPGDHKLLADMLGLNAPADTRVSTLPAIEPGDRPRSRYSSRHDAPHGTYARYQSPCHCETCNEGARIYRAELKAAKAAKAGAR